MDTLIVTYIILHDENFTIVEMCIEIIRVRKLGLGRLGDKVGLGLRTLGIGLGLVWRLGIYLVWDWSDYLGLTFGLTAWDLLGVHNWCYHDVSLFTFQF